MNILFLTKQLRTSHKTDLCRNKGFTLIEVVVALAILSISIVTVLQLFSGGLRSIKVSDDYLRASILARNKMNELESRFSLLFNQEGVFKQDDRYHWSLTVEDYDIANRLPMFKNLKKENQGNPIFVDKVRLKVFWKTKNGQREVELVTLKSSVTVKSSSKDMLMGIYGGALVALRGLQFGEQEVPSGQSESDYVKVDNISGASSLIKREFISGGETKVNICGN